MKRRIALIGLSFIFSLSAFSQTTWQWARHIGGNREEFGRNVTTDFNNNVYQVGSYSSDTLILDSDTFYSSLWDRLLITKYRPDGSVIWAQNGSSGWNSYAQGVKTDLNGNVFVVGSFQNNIHFGSVSLNTSGSNYHFFLAKLDSLGNGIWARTNTSGSGVRAYDVAIDGSGNIYVLGSYYLSILTIGSTTMTFNGEEDYFIAKYDSSGTFIWAKSFGGNSHEYCKTIAVDNAGNIYIAGTTASTGMSFNSTYFNTSFDPSFFVRYDSSGNVVWVKHVNNCRTYGVVTDISGSIYLTGLIYSNGLLVPFGMDTLSSFPLTYEMVLIKYDPLGNPIWARQSAAVNDMTYNQGVSVSLDGSNNLYITGAFSRSNLYFNSINVNNGSTLDIFIVKYDSSGNPLWAKNAGYGSPETDVGNTDGKVLFGATNTSGNEIYLSGSFVITSMVFGNDTLFNTSLTPYDNDAFIAKLSASFPTDNQNLIVNKLNNNLIFSPNPATTAFTIYDVRSTILEIEMYNVMGEKVFEKRLTSNIQHPTISVADFKPGIYFVKLLSEQGSVTRKVVIQH